MRALILSFSPIASDARVLRQAGSLSGRFELTVAGFGAPPPGGEGFVELPRRRTAVERMAQAAALATRRFEACYWSAPQVRGARERLAERKFDLVVANDIQALPVALQLAAGGAVLLDAHEFSPREFEDQFLWRTLYAPYVDHLCRRYLTRAGAMTTVAPGIAEAFHRDYGVAAGIVYSAPNHADLRPGPLREGAVRMIHHGAALRSRKLEAMIETMHLLDTRFTLDLVLVPSDSGYVEDLKRLAQGDTRIRFLPPLPVQEIVPFSNGYDVGLFLLPPTNFNYAHALPNKFFEFVQARLAVAIGPSPEMRRLAEQYGFGVVADSFEPASLAAKLNALSAADLARLKQNAHAAAGELCYERAEATFLAAVDKAMGRA